MRVDVGIDLVQVSRIAESVALFGDRFLKKIFTDGELAYATSSPAQSMERLAARFAAKEATKKALRLEGVGFRSIEVQRTASGACDLVLHGHSSPGALSVSLSHEGDYATAIVACLRPS
ncbi:MAG: holo-ACP synthase [Polyangiaceae bacterium]